jgi:pimeloyl-ACP methyl ester carboxylesterase
LGNLIFKGNVLRDFRPCIPKTFLFKNSIFEEYHVVAIDMRGYSESSKPAGVNNYTMDLLVEDIRALVHALGVERLALHRILFLPYIRPAGYSANPKAGYRISGKDRIPDIRPDT